MFALTRLSSIPRVAASVGGVLLATATRAVAAVRPARKPLHPDGDVLPGRINRTGSSHKTGVAWLDETGEDDVVVRLSRAIGLPRNLPDIHGLALRVPGGKGAPDEYADILFASTGRGRVTRFVLTMSRHPRGRVLTTLLPYQSVSGAVLLAAAASGPETYELSWARPAGEWHPFGVLRLADRNRQDAALWFDPVRHQVPGLRQYPAVTRLREPSYRRARRSRTDGFSSPSRPRS